MDNLRPRVFFQKRFRQQPDDVVPLDKLPFLIEQEAAVEVAVKGDAHVRPVFNNGLAGVVATLRQQRVGNAFREGAVRGVVDFDELHRRAQRLQARFNGVNDRPRRAVAGVKHQLQRGEIVNTDVAEQVVDVGVAHADLSVAAARGVVDRREVARFRQALNVAQTGVAAYRAGALAHQLHTVVVHRVMAGGHFNTAVHAEVEGGEVNLFGAGHTDIQHVDARVL
ncbi:Uncharacterised protein [Salmonella enterica subsp. enterica serovar Typhi]|nr:Uncharacterised protein [Salmonella enterica subsp. enterica serovar Typhi]CGX46480.1 Uncharacterised protein [Salmonella enterica subsp. enterica serovar Typhi]CII33001.1 Uncharacterised protein [Salmonella enterica subsp. enterica serovar Typhi]